MHKTIGLLGSTDSRIYFVVTLLLAVSLCIDIDAGTLSDCYLHRCIAHDIFRQDIFRKVGKYATHI